LPVGRGELSPPQLGLKECHEVVCIGIDVELCDYEEAGPIAVSLLSTVA
jgi:hypothetical protein